MNKRLLYALPAMLLAGAALTLALWGLGIQQAPPASASVITPKVASTIDRPRFEYLVAMEPLKPGDTLDQQQFRSVTSEQPLSEAILASEAPFGEPIKNSLTQGQLLTESHFSTSRILETLVPAEHQAMAIPVDDVVGVGGLLKPGDRVNVMAYFRRSDKKNNPAALTLLKDVLVLAVKGVSVGGDADDERKSGRNRNSTVVLAIPGDKVVPLLLASSEGSLRLAAIPPSQLAHTQEEMGLPDRSVSRKVESVYLDKLFPKPPKTASKGRSVTPVTRVQVFEGTDSRNVYVR